eukprot:CAMPEP_0176463998 /NCGR_PEP_ID=MMETSP0127-20121128/36245_1 /TAXON_ID=938130 /ORGANISM="Platyophrya macrostoma, Strain WH" /LENGTH=153 /DNA_ID=CAMNT_0017856311 /DNA_START=477 /DNA_END=938 /DNA_ORIENTATION=+
MTDEGIHMPPSSPVSSEEDVPQQAAAADRRPPTRLLAEFLRARSSSTDVSASRVLVYGKRGLKITDAVPHGSYGIRLEFSDNHSGGIFTYEYLAYLGGHEKFGLMREYCRELKRNRRSREPPRRAPSKLRPTRSQQTASSASSSSAASVSKSL